MRESLLIKNHIAPTLSGLGFNLCYSDNKCTVFRNSTETIGISFTTSNRCPVELTDEYITYIEDNGFKRPPKALSASYSVKATLRERTIPVDLLKSNQHIPTAYFYSSTEEFIAAATKLIDQSFRIVLPYLELISSQAVFISDAPYSLLTKNPDLQAKTFAQKHEIPLVPAPHLAYQIVKTAFEMLLPHDFSDRKKTFFSHLPEISGLVAYISTIILQLHPGKWGYLEALPSANSVIRYGIELHDIRMLNDVMWYVLDSWNYSPLLDSCGIYEQSFAKLFK